MTTNDRISLITSRLQKRFSPHHLEVIDESDKHIGHSGHQGGGRHFAIRIAASALNELPRLAAHREIYALFTDMMPHEIHAFSIKILKIDSRTELDPGLTDETDA